MVPGMNRSKLAATFVGVLSLCLAVAWAFVLWVAMSVSTIVLNTLQAIVDLAQLS